MKLRLKEDPKEWRKSGLFGALGFALLSSFLRWRHILVTPVWLAILGLLALTALVACWRPVWFRGYYRLTSRVGFHVTQFIGQTILVVVFFLLVTPLGVLLRLLGKDPLHLKRSRNQSSYWVPVKEASPLDRLF